MRNQNDTMFAEIDQPKQMQLQHKSKTKHIKNSSITL